MIREAEATASKLARDCTGRQYPREEPVRSRDEESFGSRRARPGFPE